MTLIIFGWLIGAVLFWGIYWGDYRLTGIDIEATWLDVFAIELGAIAGGPILCILFYLMAIRPYHNISFNLIPYTHREAKKDYK